MDRTDEKDQSARDRLRALPNTEGVESPSTPTIGGDGAGPKGADIAYQVADPGYGRYPGERGVVVALCHAAGAQDLISNLDDFPRLPDVVERIVQLRRRAEGAAPRPRSFAEALEADPEHFGHFVAMVCRVLGASDLEARLPNVGLREVVDRIHSLKQLAVLTEPPAPSVMGSPAAFDNLVGEVNRLSQLSECLATHVQDLFTLRRIEGELEDMRHLASTVAKVSG